ncbi:hypothetical protein [Neptuniibacter sp. QD37_11]|uniref:hypothetical protein n=1 Tax=Neptuniibacter sp. QD37_11 TaxID=3398209 RepID=UPI0039F4D863
MKTLLKSMVAGFMVGAMAVPAQGAVAYYNTAGNEVVTHAPKKSYWAKLVIEERAQGLEIERTLRLKVPHEAKVSSTDSAMKNVRDEQGHGRLRSFQKRDVSYTVRHVSADETGRMADFEICYKHEISWIDYKETQTSGGLGRKKQRGDFCDTFSVTRGQEVQVITTPTMEVRFAWSHSKERL